MKYLSAREVKHAAGSALWRIRGRRLHCFCLGAAKTGTTSFAAMFAPHYRAAHEAATGELLAMAVDVISGRAQGAAVAQWLLRRDRTLMLEVEASHPLGYFAPWLPTVFPAAKYVVTLRQPLHWLESRLNFHLHKSPELWRPYRTLIWSRFHRGYALEEQPLAELGLFSLEAYLRQYSEQYRLLFEHLPVSRRRVVATEALGSAGPALGDFLGIPAATILPRHENALGATSSVLDRLPKAFVAQEVETHCGWLVPYLEDAPPPDPAAPAGVLAP